MHSTPELPMATDRLMAHQPPLLLVHRLLARDRVGHTVLAEALLPVTGPMVATGGVLCPEYLIELMAQATAAGKGFDDLQDGKTEISGGFLVGVEDFQWLASPGPGQTVAITLHKIFEFGNVSVMQGRIEGDGMLFAQGLVKIWEEKR